MTLNLQLCVYDNEGKLNKELSDDLFFDIVEIKTPFTRAEMRELIDARNRGYIVSIIKPLNDGE